MHATTVNRVIVTNGLSALCYSTRTYWYCTGTVLVRYWYGTGTVHVLPVPVCKAVSSVDGDIIIPEQRRLDIRKLSLCSSFPYTMKLLGCSLVAPLFVHAVSGWMFHGFLAEPRIRMSTTTSKNRHPREERCVSRLDLKKKTTTNHSEQARAQRRTIEVSSTGKEAHLRSRTLDISSDWKITVWEWEQPAEVVETYWRSQAQSSENGKLETARNSGVLDPFGLVSWPGSVVAAQALKSESSSLSSLAIDMQDHSVLILGAGVGVEAQAVAELGAKSILATDIHPTTFQQLELGIMENKRITNKDVLQTQIFDLMGNQPLPMPYADLIIAADVLYNEELAGHVARRLVEGWIRNPKVKILVTDSQRFVDFVGELERQFSQQQQQQQQHASPNIQPPDIDFTEQTLAAFTGSGVVIDEDQTYDVKVRKIWIGLK